MAGSSADNSTFDLGRQRIGTVYAKALLGAADNADQTAVVLDEFQSLLEDVIFQREDLRHAITGAILSEEQRIAILDKAFGDKMSPVLLTFLKVVTQHKRQDCLSEIYQAARQIDNQRRGLIEVTATTATELPEQLAGSLTDRLKEKLGREVVLKTKVDPNVIGGLVLHVGDTVFDGSIANQLQHLREKALANTAQQAKATLERFTNSTQN